MSNRVACASEHSQNKIIVMTDKIFRTQESACQIRALCIAEEMAKLRHVSLATFASNGDFPAAGWYPQAFWNMKILEIVGQVWIAVDNPP